MASRSSKKSATANTCFVGGLHSVDTLLQQTPERVLCLYVQKGRDDQRLQRLLHLAKQQGIALQQLSRETLDARAPDLQHQGILAECRVTPALAENALMPLLEQVSKPLLLILDGVQDPHNLGACLRTANAAGVNAVIAPRDRSVGLTSTVRKVACGAAELVPFVQVTNLARTLRDLQEQQIYLVGTADEAQQSLYATDLTGSLAIVMGAEGHGLRRLTREHCDVLVTIPMLGQVSSLNVSVATGVCLFEAIRQRNRVI